MRPAKTPRMPKMKAKKKARKVQGGTMATCRPKALTICTCDHPQAAAAINNTNRKPALR